MEPQDWDTFFALLNKMVRQMDENNLKPFAHDVLGPEIDRHLQGDNDIQTLIDVLTYIY